MVCKRICSSMNESEPIKECAPRIYNKYQYGGTFCYLFVKYVRLVSDRVMKTRSVASRICSYRNRQAITSISRVAGVESSSIHFVIFFLFIKFNESSNYNEWELWNKSCLFIFELLRKMCDCSNKLNFFENMFRIKTKIYVFMRLKIEKKYEKDVVCELRQRGH